VQYKIDRPDAASGEAAAKTEALEKSDASAKAKAKPGKSAAKAAAKPAESAAAEALPAADGKVGLLVRLYFSAHEKLSEQRWIDRIPSEEPFKSASPKVIHHNDPEFETTDQQFEALT
jgi:hypothetical protein